MHSCADLKNYQVRSLPRSALSGSGGFAEASAALHAETVSAAEIRDPIPTPLRTWSPPSSQVVDVPEGRGLADCEDVKRNLHPERATALRPLRKQPRTAFSLQQTPTLSIPEGAAPAAASPASSTFPSGTTKSGSGIAVQEEKSGAFETAPFTPFECPPQTAETPLQKNWKRVRLSRPRFCFEVQIHRGGRLCDLCAERLGASNSRTTSAASEWPAAASCGEGGGEGRGETKASEDSSASSSAGVGCVAAAGNEDESSALSASGPVVKAEQKEASASPGSPPKRARDASRPFPSEGASAAGGVVGEGRRRGGAAGGWRRGRSGVVSSGKGAGGQFGEDEDEGAECTCEGGTEDASGRPRFERLPLVVINYAEQSPHIDRAVRKKASFLLGAAKATRAAFVSIQSLKNEALSWHCGCVCLRR